MLTGLVETARTGRYSVRKFDLLGLVVFRYNSSEWVEKLWLLGSSTIVSSGHVSVTMFKDTQPCILVISGASNAHLWYFFDSTPVPRR